MAGTIERIHLTVNGVTYALGPLEDLNDLRDQVLRAANAGGGFLNVTTDSGARLSFYVTSATPIVIAVVTIELNARTADRVQDEGCTGPIGFLDDDVPFDI